MRDDELKSFVPEVGRSVIAADFDEIVRGARRRRRFGFAATIAGTSALVVAVIAGSQLVDIDHRGSAPPVTNSSLAQSPTSPPPSTTETETTVPPKPWRHLSPAEVIADPRAWPQQIAVSTSDADLAAVVWSRTFADGWSNWATTVTADGWQTSRQITPEPDSKDAEVQSLNDGSIVLQTTDAIWLLGHDLSWQPLTIERGEWPIQPGEAWADDQIDGTHPFAVDPVAMTARVIVEPGYSVEQRADGSLFRYGPHPGYSLDGGATWQQAPAPSYEELLDPLAPNVTAVLSSQCEGGGCPEPLKVSLDGGASWTRTTIPFGGQATLLSDGTVVISDTHHLYLSPLGSGELNEIDLGPIDGEISARGLSVQDGVETLTACDSSRCWTSSDEGATWEPAQLR